MDPVFKRGAIKPFCLYQFNMSPLNIVARDNSVGIATCWTVRESKPGGGEIFHFRPERPLGPTSRDNSVGIATWWTVPWIEARWRRGFSFPSRTALGPNQLAKQWVSFLSRR